MRVKTLSLPCCLQPALDAFRGHGCRTKPFQIRSVLCPSRAYSSTDEEKMMPFVEYRKLRRRIKLRSRLAGLPMALVGVTLSSAVNVHFHPQMLEFQNPEVELTPILGMDPLAFAVLCGISSGVVGYLLGGATFTATWKLVFKQKAQKLQEREDDFLGRLQQYRFSGVNKFDDDYYGDKVNTLADYRQWVRQQQRKKATSLTELRPQ